MNTTDKIRNEQHPESASNGELERFWELVGDIKIAMLTTRRADGHLRSRAMATQKRASGADLWFVTLDDAPKVQEIAEDPHVNLSYYRDKNSEWVSVSGLATLSRDRAKIKELYAPDWKMWFGEEGDPRHGTPDDPRMVLIGVTIHAAEFLEVNKPRPVILFELVKGWLTGQPAELGTMHKI
jgi:general stress protein 26